MLMDATPPSGPLQQHALPVPVTNVPVPDAPVARSPKHFLAAFFLSFFLGVFGADRFYLGYYVSGALKLLTFGWFGIGAIVDLALIMNGAMTDSHNRPLAGYPEYKATARKTVLWITVACAAILVVSAIAGVMAVQSIMSSPYVNNILNQSTGSGGQMPDLNSLSNGIGSL